MTVAQFEAMFPHEEACREYLKARRWPEGPHCPRCGNPEVYELRARRWHWQCEQCATDGYRFSITVGTIFENTNKPLRDWFRVTHLMLTSKKGISALQIQRMMGFVSYGTAHSMCHKIRAALVEPETKLGGIVEVDETFIGGKSINKHGGRAGRNWYAKKVPIIGAVSRKGNVIARVLRAVTKQDAETFVREVVSDKVSLLATDESRVYNDLFEYAHKTVNHSGRQYVIGAVHTNTIEAFGASSSAGSSARSTR